MQVIKRSHDLIQNYHNDTPTNKPKQKQKKNPKNIKNRTYKANQNTILNKQFNSIE